MENKEYLVKWVGVDNNDDQVQVAIIIIAPTADIAWESVKKQYKEKTELGAILIDIHRI